MVAGCARVLGCAPGPGGWPPGRRLLVLLALAVTCGSLGLPGVAHADDPAPACPERPADYEPSSDPDPVIAELRALRQDQSDACAQLRAQLLEVRSATGNPVELAGVDASHPLPVHDSDQTSTLTLDDESSGALVDAFDNVGTVLHTDLWFVIGLLCALPFSYFLARLVMARG